MTLLGQQMQNYKLKDKMQTLLMNRAKELPGGPPKMGMAPGQSQFGQPAGA
jgi:hypothetical protein